MLTKQVLTSLLIAATATTAFGCQMMPTNQAPTTPAQADLPPEMALKSDRQLKAELPQQISVADAERLLVTIDPSQVKDEATRSVQQWGFHGLRRGFFGFGHHRPFLFNRFRFFRHRNFFFPFSFHGSFYRPFLYNNCYNPFLYNYGSSYYPYTYSSCGGFGY